MIKKGEQEGVGGVTIGRIPLMLRSDRCVLKGKSEDELACLGERFACVPAFPCVHEGSCDMRVISAGHELCHKHCGPCNTSLRHTAFHCGCRRVSTGPRRLLRREGPLCCSSSACGRAAHAVLQPAL